MKNGHAYVFFFFSAANMGILDDFMAFKRQKKQKV